MYIYDRRNPIFQAGAEKQLRQLKQPISLILVEVVLASADACRNPQFFILADSILPPQHHAAQPAALRHQCPGLRVLRLAGAVRAPHPRKARPPIQVWHCLLRGSQFLEDAQL